MLAGRAGLRTSINIDSPSGKPSGDYRNDDISWLSCYKEPDWKMENSAMSKVKYN